MIMLSLATRVMSDRQPIALIGHDGLELGAGWVTYPVYHLRATNGDEKI